MWSRRALGTGEDRFGLLEPLFLLGAQLGALVEGGLDPLAVRLDLLQILHGDCVLAYDSSFAFSAF